jgi:hypothetical protein
LTQARFNIDEGSAKTKVNIDADKGQHRRRFTKDAGEG